ncbi:MAG TPA: type II toxin-antitoxin system RatA family toxin [Beijerinckiaceae bacterium]|nr:type II toxin-antitoxin system RatA family toxin [Beijerinckiaceae bacterium]
MPAFRTSRSVRHSARQMFDLVADVASYPELVPLCLGTRILRRGPAEREGAELVTAEMRIGYKAIRETFTSRVTLDPAKLEILVEYVDGPFRRMHNRWGFRDELSPSEGAPRSRVDFFIDYEFRNRALGLLMGVMFDTAFRRFAQAFEERADRVYSGAGLSPATASDPSH